MMSQLKKRYVLHKEVYGSTQFGDFEYVGPSVVKHTVCGHLYDSDDLERIMHGDVCPKCDVDQYKKIRSLRHLRDYDVELSILTGDEYDYLDDIEPSEVRPTTSLTYRHNLCGNTFTKRVKSFEDGQRCICEKTKNYKQELYRDFKGEYTLTEDIKEMHHKVTYRHTTCGKEFKATPSNFEQGLCPHCRKGVQFKKDVENQVGDEYKIVSEFKNHGRKVQIKHVKCGHTFEMLPKTFLRGGRCPQCRVRKSPNHAIKERYKDDVKYKTDGEYEVLEDYVLGATPIRHRHSECGHEFKVAPTNFKQGSRCPQCGGFKGELGVAKHLTLRDLEYMTQVSFKDLKYKGNLRYDFAIIKNNKIDALIEFDGEQHYRPIEFFGGDEAFKKQQFKDKLKTNYARDNGIPLIRIRFDEYDILDFILDTKLKELGIL